MKFSISFLTTILPIVSAIHIEVSETCGSCAAVGTTVCCPITNLSIDGKQCAGYYGAASAGSIFSHKEDLPLELSNEGCPWRDGKMWIDDDNNIHVIDNDGNDHSCALQGDCGHNIPPIPVKGGGTIQVPGAEGGCSCDAD
ncbi:hypothetical protein CAAN1_11S00716 [[Candida] anglica]|uniref:Uncharacterized protein n=1 Tax=[Candida] anglica TaxID=148631 RepID=A0ABP0EJV8_9ASCO